MKHLFTHDLSVRWGDMDAQQHINNSVFFRYVEDARVAWLMALTNGWRGLDGQASVVVHTAMTFLQPVYYPARLRLTLRGGNAGRSSFDTTVTIQPLDADGEPGTAVAEGTAKIVWCDQSTGKSMPLPEIVRVRLA